MTTLDITESPRLLGDCGRQFSLRPMRYPQFYEMFRAAISNTWTIDEIDFSVDVMHLRGRATASDLRIVEKLVAFFATGDSIVSDNLILGLYRHVNSPEARLYMSRQMFEEALHVQFYLTVLDTYLADDQRRAEAFAAIDRVPAIRRKADFCLRWTNAINSIASLSTREDRRQFLLNLIAYAACVEGLFFFAAFAYVYYFRSRGLFPGLAAGTSWVFRDESSHIRFGYELIRLIRAEEPELLDSKMEDEIREMMAQAIDAELLFAQDTLQDEVGTLTSSDMRKYLEYVASMRLNWLEISSPWKAANPFDFVQLQDVPELTNFFERRVTGYRLGIAGTVRFDASF
jgi:ribonucleoside-diphosphate reductase beta chain